MHVNNEGCMSGLRSFTNSPSFTDFINFKDFTDFKTIYLYVLVIEDGTTIIKSACSLVSSFSPERSS
jgi:hypothetical protein